MATIESLATLCGLSDDAVSCVSRMYGDDPYYQRAKQNLICWCGFMLQQNKRLKFKNQKTETRFYKLCDTNSKWAVLRAWRVWIELCNQASWLDAATDIIKVAEKLMVNVGRFADNMYIRWTWLHACVAPIVHDGLFALHHGTTLAAATRIVRMGIDLKANIAAAYDLDFGPGFYMTNSFEAAASWAVRRDDQNCAVLTFFVTYSLYKEICHEKLDNESFMHVVSAYRKHRLGRAKQNGDVDSDFEEEFDDDFDDDDHPRGFPPHERTQKCDQAYDPYEVATIRPTIWGEVCSNPDGVVNNEPPTAIPGSDQVCVRAFFQQRTNTQLCKALDASLKVVTWIKAQPAKY